MPSSFQIETVDHWYADAHLMVIDHWKELGLDLDLKPDLDIEKMKVIEDLGDLFVLTAREDGKLVGYILCLVVNHLHYKSSPKMLIVDMYYVVPEARKGTGLRLLKFMEEFAHHRGTIKIYLTCKVHKDHSALFTGMGYRLSDYAFIKRIGA